ncbi:hypothetical protein [Glaesserella sp.]|uniref:hypothetical protein n=1 Tax=Glaesserella sp. TaxID=2094731 RepID=UPI0035A116F7
MKLHQSLLAVLLSVGVVAYAQAEVVKITPTVEEKAVKKNISPSKAERSLKNFTDNIDVKYLGVELGQDKNGQTVVNFKYSAENKSTRNMRIVHWKASYIYNNKLILIQDTPVSFKDNLKRKTTSELVFTVPLKSLPDDVQAILSEPDVQLSAHLQPQSILYSNGAKILVSY